MQLSCRSMRANWGFPGRFSARGESGGETPGFANRTAKKLRGAGRNSGGGWQHASQSPGGDRQRAAPANRLAKEMGIGAVLGNEICACGYPRNMDTLFCDKSALACIRHFRSNGQLRQRGGPSGSARIARVESRLARHSERLFRESRPSAEEIAGAPVGSWGIPNNHLDLLVPQTGFVPIEQEIRYRAWLCPLPEYPFFEVSPGIFCSSPEFAFIQMAHPRHLEDAADGVAALARLIRLGFELCGSYSLDRSSEHGFVVCLPVTTPSRLQAAIDRAGRFRGARVARRAVRHLLKSSASPAETNLAMLSCLPPLLGGRKIPLPTLNAPVELDDVARTLVGSQGPLRCDMLWKVSLANGRTRRIAAEYDSDDWHADKTRLQADNDRRAALRHMGVVVHTITSDQLNDARKLDAMIDMIACEAGWRLPRRNPRSQAALRSALFGVRLR